MNDGRLQAPRGQPLRALQRRQAPESPVRGALAFGTLQIDLYDAKDGKLVWRGSGEQLMRSQPPTPAERERAIRETVTQVLSQYPPR